MRATGKGVRDCHRHQRFDDPENLVYLLRFDSAYRRYDEPVAYEPGVEPTLCVGRTRMRLVNEREPKGLPWKTLGVDIVIEATGAFAIFEQARAHITGAAQRVVLTAPAQDADAAGAARARTVLVGVNEDQFNVSVLSGRDFEHRSSSWRGREPAPRRSTSSWRRRHQNRAGPRCSQSVVMGWTFHLKKENTDGHNEHQNK